MNLMTKILLIGAGTQALAIVKSLAKVGYVVCMFVGEHGNYADASRFVNKTFFCNESSKGSAYLNYVEELISSEGIDVLLPMGDESAEFLSKNKDRLQRIVKFTAPDYDAFLKGYDKNKLMSLCREKVIRILRRSTCRKQVLRTRCCSRSLIQLY